MEEQPDSLENTWDLQCGLIGKVYILCRKFYRKVLFSRPKFIGKVWFLLAYFIGKV